MTSAEIKHKKFARELVKNGGNGTLAYSKVYPSSTRSVSASSASRLLKNENVKKEIRSYAEEIANVTGPKFIAKRLKDLCSAEKGVFYEGVRMDTEPDNPTRMAAVRTVLQSQGVLAEKSGASPNVNGVSVSINLIKIENDGA